MANVAPRWLPIIGIVGLLWNSLGVWAYLGHVDLVAAMEPPSAVPMPAIVHAGFAIGVFGAMLGCLGLVLRRRWARAVLWVSLAGSIVDWAWVFGWSGAGVSALGVTVLVLSLLLAVVGEHAARKGWLR